MKIRAYIKRFITYRLYVLARQAFYPEKIEVLEERLKGLFLSKYEALRSPGLDRKTLFKNAEFKVQSKHGCDGILALIFSKIGVKNHTFVEMGIEDGRECNTANL